MSATSQVPSSAERGADRSGRAVGVGHVVQAVERRDEAQGPVRRERPLPRVVELGVGQARCRQALLGSVESVAGDVVAGEAAGRKRSGHAQHTGAGPAPHVGGGGARREALDHPVEPGQQVVDEVVAHPRLEAALHPDRGLGPERVVVVPDARAEALGQGGLQQAHALRQLVEHAEQVHLVRLVGQHGHGGRGQCEPLAPARVRLDQPGGRLVVGPLADPPLGQPRTLGQLGAGQRIIGVGEGAVEAQPVAEVDHGRGHRPRHLVRHRQGEQPDLDGVGCGGRVRVGGRGHERDGTAVRRCDTSSISASDRARPGLRYSFVTFRRRA